MLSDGCWWVSASRRRGEGARRRFVDQLADLVQNDGAYAGRPFHVVIEELENTPAASLDDVVVKLSQVRLISNTDQVFLHERNVWFTANTSS
jgi:hypothetical protein